jgi:hypothetical protein
MAAIVTTDLRNVFEAGIAAAQIGPQPNQTGEFDSPADGAVWMATAYGIPQTPLKGKAPFLPNWPAKASVDPAQIRAWAAEYPGCNFGSVAILGSHFVFEADKPADGMPTVRERFKQQGHDFTAKLIIESSPGKGHRYYLSAPGVENIGQNAVKHGDFSVRADGEQCVSPGSVHPATGRQYRVAVLNGPLTPPTTEEILFWNSERVESQKAAPISQNEPIPSGKRNSTVTSILGRARQQNALEYDALLALARQHNQRCSPPLPESELETIAQSISKYAVKPGGEGSVLLGGQVVGQGEQPAPITPVRINAIPYPVFPTWVFGGIPAFNKWVKPFCKVNSRYPEYMMLPLMVLILNYLGTKGVRIEYKGFPLSIYLLLVGRKGRVIKSSSAQDAMKLCQNMGILNKFSEGITNADAKTLVFTMGSSEGLGLAMDRTQCKSAVLFYDEFSKLVAKMGIENSSFANDLSTCYESQDFANGTKSRKESFQHPAGSYCLSLIGCTTDRSYPRMAAKLFASVDGMDERFFVLYQPEVLKDVEPMTDMPIPDDVVTETKAAIDRALEKRVYSIDDSEPLRPISKLGNRVEIRAEKWALAFAILLGRDLIDGGCVERGVALAKYEDQVKRYLQVGEAITREGSFQREIRLHAERAGGRIKLRDLQRLVRHDDIGTENWRKLYGGLLGAGIFAESGTGVPGDPKIVTVLVPLMRDDDEN